MMASPGSVQAQLRARVQAEREREESLSEGQLRELLRGDGLARARAALVYFTAPAALPARLGAALDEVERSAATSSPARKVELLRWLAGLAIDLGSAATAWGRLRPLPPEARGAQSARAAAALEALARREPGAHGAFLTRLREEEAARARAEGIADPAATAAFVEEAVGASAGEHVARALRDVQGSALRAAADAFHEGRIATVFGNDYAEFLPRVVWLGGAFATTNPVLVKLAWDIDPEHWNRQVDQVVRGGRSGAQGADAGAVDALAADVTVGVVERNCRVLRPIFLATGGTHGYVSMQVDPTAHDDPARMAATARDLHGELERRLGGVPNAVIKLPSTAAGLVAARELTAQGIGVTITLTFSLFQAVPFARVLSAGEALVSYIAVMNGRLAFPVRDELGRAGVAGGAEAARWAGVEVARKACRLLYAPPGQGGVGADPDRVKVMIASLRIYGEWIPDLTELWGVPLVTIFPNVRRAYDLAPRPPPAPALSAATPPEALEVLLRSEIFRQAWWTEADGDRGRPARPLSLAPADAAAVAAWAPVGETLAQFIGTFDEMRTMVRARLSAAR
jgi:transaldolase